MVATSNPGKLRDFAGAARRHGVELRALPNFAELPTVVEDGTTFEENARKKAEHYSRLVAGEIVLADDSGLEVFALDGAPGVRSARYASPLDDPNNADDGANNERLLQELANIGDRRGRFVCVLAAAREGRTLATFRGEAEGVILDRPRGSLGFGYDPLFYVPAFGRTFAELSAEKKAGVSHRGRAFEKFLSWHEEHFRK
jgi:XTP/dITP diphosphohydrolase